MRILISIFFLISLVSCNEEKCQPSNWELVYKNNADGKDVFGDKQILIDAVRKGYPVRIGFGGRRANDTLKSIEHFADAAFLSILNGKEVFTQINSIYGQKPNLDADTVNLKVKHENEWTLIIGTNGERSTLSRHFEEGLTKESQQSNRGCNWYIKTQATISERDVLPIWD